MSAAAVRGVVFAAWNPGEVVLLRTWPRKVLAERLLHLQKVGQNKKLNTCTVLLTWTFVVFLDTFWLLNNDLPQMTFHRSVARKGSSFAEGRPKQKIRHLHGLAHMNCCCFFWTRFGSWTVTCRKWRWRTVTVTCHKQRFKDRRIYRSRKKCVHGQTQIAVQSKSKQHDRNLLDVFFVKTRWLTLKLT